MVEFVHMFTIFLIRVTCIVKSLEFFTVKIKLAEMAVLASKDLITAKKNYIQWGSTCLTN